MIHAVFGSGELTEELRNGYKTLCISLAMLPGYSFFLVGNETDYEQSVVSLMREIHEEYPCFDYAIISVPESKGEIIEGEASYCPKFLRDLPYELTVWKRTEWMLEKADSLLCSIAEADKVNGKLLAEAKEEGKKVYAEGNVLMPEFEKVS